MTVWHLAMLCMFVLMVTGPKMRTWAALMLAGTAPWLLPEMAVPAYIVIDAIAVAIVLRRPAGCAQRAIGACFALLVMFHVGFLASFAGGNTDMYYQANVVTGWVQFALLAAWGLADVGKVVLHRLGHRRGLPTVGPSVR